MRNPKAEEEWYRQQKMTSKDFYEMREGLRIILYGMRTCEVCGTPLEKQVDPCYCTDLCDEHQLDGDLRRTLLKKKAIQQVLDAYFNDPIELADPHNYLEQIRAILTDKEEG